MKYIKYFESYVDDNGAVRAKHGTITASEVDKCVALVYKKTGVNSFSGKLNCERSEDKNFKGTKSLEKAIEWTKEKIKDNNIGGVIIYRNIKDIAKDGNMLRWWSAPNSNGMFCNTTGNVEKDASNLSRYIFGMSNAYVTFGKDYPNQHTLCNIRTKAPKSWQTIQNMLGTEMGNDMNNAADMDEMGFSD